MHTLTLYYSVSNGGDGSAYPKWFLSEELAQIHQDINNELSGEGWGENCVGEISMTSESPIHIDTSFLGTKETLLKSLDYYLERDYHHSEGIKKLAQNFVDRINELS